MSTTHKKVLYQSAKVARQHGIRLEAVRDRISQGRVSRKEADKAKERLTSIKELALEN
jgi:hypothetical protein